MYKDIISRVLREYVNDNNTEGKNKLLETSKRHKLHPRTLSDLDYVTDILYKSYKDRDDDTPKKGQIYVEDPTGDYAFVPVYYLSSFQSQGGVFNIDKNKPRNLYNVFIVTNPDESLEPNRKSIYNFLYHEIQHLVDLNTTSKISSKKIGDYNPEDPEKYFGHDFEFKAYVNEILEGIVNEYKDLFGRYSKEELSASLDSILSYFGKSGELDDIARKVLYNISSEQDNDEYPHVIQLLYLLKRYNPKKWNDFLKMLYSTMEEISKEVEMTEEFKKPRKYSKSYCEKTPCEDMGFSQKASCRPYKDCYK